MPRSLYLDTARLGRMSPTALRIHSDFVRLAAEEPCSLYCEKFLRYGIDAAPEFRERFPQLKRWNGVSELKQQLAKTLSDGCNPAQVLLMSRTQPLMELGARLLVQRCRRVLVPDVVWPPYLRTLRRTAAKSGCDVVLVAVRSQLFGAEISQSELTEFLCDQFERHKCDGLLLPLVDHCGARLPVESWIGSLNDAGRLRCSVVDASQAFGHVDTRTTTAAADFVFGGCHKWMRGYLPLGVGFVGNDETAVDVGTLIETGHLADPLFRTFFSSRNRALRDPRETVNVTPLLTCRGAITDAGIRQSNAQEANRNFCSEQLLCTGWTPLMPEHRMRTGIVLARSNSSAMRCANPERVRQSFRRAGLSVTTYAGGFVRLSMPFSQFEGGETDALCRGLESVVHVGVNRTASPHAGEFGAPWLESALSRPPSGIDSPIAGC